MRGESEMPGGALNLISTNYPDHGHHGHRPRSRKNAHGRAGNRTRDLMVSSQELWPPSLEAGRFSIFIIYHSLPSLWPKTREHFHIYLPLEAILSQIQLAFWRTIFFLHTIRCYENYFVWNRRPILLHACYMHALSHPPSFDQISIFVKQYKTVKHLVTQLFSPLLSTPL